MAANQVRIPVLAAILSGAAVALVVAAAGGAVPSRLLPAAPDPILGAIPHVNVVLSLLAIGVIAHGWRAIRRGDVTGHRRSMVLATGIFATFLVLYLYRLVVVGGATPFPGPETVYRTVYLPVLTLHIGLAIACIPLVIYTLLLGLVTPTTTIPETRHATVGRVAATLWMVSFAGGIAVYALLHQLY